MNADATRHYRDILTASSRRRGGCRARTSPARYAPEDILSRETRSHTEARHGIRGSSNGYVKVT